MSRYGLQAASFPDVEGLGFRGLKTEDVVDTAQAAVIQQHINAISSRATIKIPQNTPFDQQRALTDLFCKYQLAPIAGASTHPATDAFRRICDNYVVDMFGAQNIVEVGPSLSKLSTQPRLFPAHSCSPTLDNRDRARALQCRFKIAPNHPHNNTLLARSSGQYPNPAVMCSNRGQDCQEQHPVLYSSYSLQDSTPSDLVAMMRAHGAHIAVVALSLPIPLQYVTAYHDADTGARWTRTGTAATCHAGVGDAGYTHSLATLNQWTDGFEDVPLFGEVLKQYGSNLLFQFTLNTDIGGCEQYPMLVASTLEKYSVIPSNLGTQFDFLTSNSHYERLVSYLTIHHAKFAQNLFKAALERISVLTPAIVLGSTKHTNRWVVTSDERIDIAIAACHDVQRTLHRAELANELVNVNNTQLASDARHARRALTPGLYERVAAMLRGEKCLEFDLGLLDTIADALDGGRNASALKNLGALPKVQLVANGCAGQAEPLPAPTGEEPPPPPPPPAAQPYQPERNGFPAPAAWHPVHDQVWAEALQALPAARQARLRNAFDPVQALADAENGHLARPVDGLSQIHRHALDNVAWSVDTGIQTLLVGPAGSGKTTVANRICPAGTVIIVPTDDLATQWRARRPAATVLTLDAAMCQPRVLRTAPCILIDEMNKFPAVYINTFASFHIPTVALFDLGQGAYAGHLGAPASLDTVPIDHIAVFNNTYRGGEDVRQFLSQRMAHLYRREFVLPAAWDFVTPNVGLQSFQRQIVNRNGHHLVCQRANTNIIAGASTIGSAQGSEWPNVYVHLFDGDEAYFRRNIGDLIVAVTRANQTTTITVPHRGANNLHQFLNGHRLPFVRRPFNNQVFGSAHPVLDNPTDERELPGAFPQEDTISAGLTILAEIESRGLDFHAVDIPPCPVNMAAVLEIAATSPPDPAQLTNQEADIKFRRPDGRIRGFVDEWEPTKTFQEPTVLPHVGYPFSNSEQLSSIHAIFDRYLKPQNVQINYKDACITADFMFGAWVDAYIDPSVAVTLPSTNDLLAHWLSKRTASELASIDESALRADSAGLFLSTYFLKAQAKPKFGAFGHQMECGQGIIAMEKLINASECPLLIGAVKTMQAMFKSHVVYDSGYSVEELDAVVAGILPNGELGSLSIDLSQQDSSHMLVHRLLIAKVLKFLGFGDMVCSAYLISREMRAVKGMTLNVLFTVIERLFSGEPGTAFFNFIMSSATTASTFDLRNIRLFLGKGDDNTTVPIAPRRSTAAQIIRKTGVIQKNERLPYLDFANRIWCTTRRSFSDPLRLLSKYTCRLTSRDNTDNEFQAWIDYDFTPNNYEALELAEALTLKHGIEWHDATDVVTCAHALNDRATYMSMLRPGKLPADDMTTIRHCCGHEVVFEDLADRCAVEAVALLADSPVAEVVACLQTLRLAAGVPLEVLERSEKSAHPDNMFVTRSELSGLARHFQFSLASGRDGLRLHTCNGHVSVVRVNVQRSAIRSFCAVFGSWSTTTRIGLNLFLYFCVLFFLATCWIGGWILSRLIQQRAARSLDGMASELAQNIPKPAAVKLRHQPLVYGSSGMRSRAFAFATLVYRGGIASVTLLMAFIAFQQFGLIMYLLPDFLEALGTEIPVFMVLRFVMVNFFTTNATMNGLLGAFALGWTQGLSRQWRSVCVNLVAFVVTAAAITQICNYFGWVVDDLLNASNVLGFTAGVAYSQLPKTWQRIGASWFGNAFHYLLLWSIVFMLKVSYFIAITCRQYKRGGTRTHGPTNRTICECKTQADELLKYCMRTVVTSKGKQAREFYRKCHPDKLRQLYPRELIDVIETNLGSGEHEAAYESIIMHPCPIRTTTTTTTGITTATTTTTTTTTTTSKPTPETFRRTRTVDDRPTKPWSTSRRRATTSSSATTCPWTYTPTSTATAIATATMAAPAPTSTPAFSLPSTNWFSLFIVLFSLVMIVLFAFRILHQYQCCADLQEIVDAMPLVNPVPTRSPSPYGLRFMPSPRRQPLRLTWVDPDHVIPAHNQFRHGSIGQAYSFGLPIQNAPGFGQFLPNPTPDYEFGKVRRDLIVRNSTADPACITRWTQLLAMASRAYGATANWSPVQKLRFLRNVPRITKIGANEATPVCLRLLQVITPTFDQAEVDRQVQLDIDTCGYRASNLRFMLPEDQRLYRTTYLDRTQCSPVTLTILGSAASGKTTTYINLLPFFPRVLIIAISNELKEELERKIATRARNHVDVMTPHRPLLDNVQPGSYDLVIVDEVWALPRVHTMQLASLGRLSLAAGDPTQIADIGLNGVPMPFHTGCSLYTIIADFSFTMPQDIASFLITRGRLPLDFVCLSPVARSVYINSDPADIPDDAEFRSIARQCGPTIHTFQGQRTRVLHAHVCAIDASNFSFSGISGHGTTLLTRHTDELHLDLTEELRGIFERDMEAIARRGGF